MTQISIILISFFIVIFSGIAQNSANKKVLLTLQPGESIIITESCIDFTVSGNQMYLVTQQNRKIFVYENGQRKGPYNSFTAAKVKNCGSFSGSECSIYSSTDHNDNMNQYIFMSDDGRMGIKFNGKTYGPYKMVSEIKVSKDKSTFYAMVANDDLKFNVITSDPSTPPIKANISKLLVSSSGKKFLAIDKGEDLDADILKTDFSKMSTEQIMKMAQKMEEKKKAAGEPQATIYTNGGKKFGPYPAKIISDYNPVFSKTGGDNWFMFIDHVLYINGVKIKQFDNISPNTCDIWISSDGKRYLVKDYDSMIFSDGSKYKAPIKFDFENKNGKTLLKWISFENGKELISYSREL